MNNHGFGIRNEQGIANLEQRKMQASVKKHTTLKQALPALTRK